MKLFTAEQMQSVDRQAMDEGQICGERLMHNAGMAVVKTLERFEPCSVEHPLVVLAGGGNNGGDGFVIAAAMLRRGWTVQTIVLAEAATIEGDAAHHLQALRALEPQPVFCTDEADLMAALATVATPGMIIDALLGTGIRSQVRRPFDAAIGWINQQACPVVAVDVPSGVNADTGEICGTAVEADHTVTFAGGKAGLFTFPGAAYCGDIEITDIGIPARYLEACALEIGWFEASEARKRLHRRGSESHKGENGHCLVVAGAVGKCGAAVLSSLAGLRGGAGLVTLACPQPIHDGVAMRVTEVMTEGLAHHQGAFSESALKSLFELRQSKQAMVVGPGIGTAPEQQHLIGQLVGENPVPMVIDADGLNCLVGQRDVLETRKAPLILTPHPGEMARLIGKPIAHVQAHRLDVARDFATRHQVVVVLKGARTLIALPSGVIWINASGNPALGTAGTGDVLAGLIGGLLAQGYSENDAALLGVYLHGAAADRLAHVLGESGLIASDLLPEIPRTRYQLYKGETL